MTTERDRADFLFLFETARAGRAAGLANFLHLDQPIGIWNYIRIANEIAALVPPGRLLDWGCGLGQMTYLLRRRGFDVVPYDLGETADALPLLPLTQEVRVVRGTHPTALPFRTGEFDAVLSCGVLEHVDEYSGMAGNEMLSLREIHRVVRPDGWFPIYQLPQRLAWQESISRALRLGYSHPRRFSSAEILALLQSAGFTVESIRRNNMLPKNLTGLPAAVRDVYSLFARPLIAIDSALSSVPFVNRFAGVLELIARRR